MSKPCTKEPEGISQQLKQWRLKIGLTQTQLVEKVKIHTGTTISVSTIKQFEESARQPSKNTIRLISIALSQETMKSVATDIRTKTSLCALDNAVKSACFELENVCRLRKAFFQHGFNSEEFERKIDQICLGIYQMLSQSEYEDFRLSEILPKSGDFQQAQRQKCTNINSKNASTKILDVSRENHRIECTEELLLIRWNGKPSLQGTKEAGAIASKELSNHTQPAYIVDMRTAIPPDFSVLRYSIEWLKDLKVRGIVCFGARIEDRIVVELMMNSFHDHGCEPPISVFCNNEKQAKACLDGLRQSWTVLT